MEILKCTSGTIEIKLDDEFKNITIRASGERILDYKGFCISVGSIKQIEPTEMSLPLEKKKRIANAIARCKTLSRPIEFYEES